MQSILSLLLCLEGECNPLPVLCACLAIRPVWYDRGREEEEEEEGKRECARASELIAMRPMRECLVCGFFCERDSYERYEGMPLKSPSLHSSHKYQEMSFLCFCCVFFASERKKKFMRAMHSSHKYEEMPFLCFCCVFFASERVSQQEIPSLLLCIHRCCLGRKFITRSFVRLLLFQLQSSVKFTTAASEIS